MREVVESGRVRESVREKRREREEERENWFTKVAAHWFTKVAALGTMLRKVPALAMEFCTKEANSAR